MVMSRVVVVRNGAEMQAATPDVYSVRHPRLRRLCGSRSTLS